MPSTLTAITLALCGAVAMAAAATKHATHANFMANPTYSLQLTAYSLGLMAYGLKLMASWPRRTAAPRESPGSIAAAAPLTPAAAAPAPQPGRASSCSCNRSLAIRRPRHGSPENPPPRTASSKEFPLEKGADYRFGRKDLLW